jgi:CysZ protein
MSTFSTGAGDLGRGFAFLNQHPRLWGWVMAPAVLTLLILIGAVMGVMHLVDPLVAWLTDWLPGFLQGIAGALIWLLVIVALGFGALFVFVTVVGIVAGPFNEMLSESIEAIVTRQPSPKFSLRAFLRGALVGLLHGLRRLLVALAGFLLLFALGFIPVIGTLAALAIGFWLAARAAAYDCYDAVLSRRELSYGQKQAYLARHRSRTFGLGVVVAALLLVPLVNLVVLGLGAAGATLADLDPTSVARRPPGRLPQRL